uniref:Neur_chan_LBD domain-containing protein n=1 Tax=Syphacia muris TaxID=451379 RepID=A0A0N5AD96_9BILA
NTVVDPLSDITQPDQFRLVHDKLQNYDSKVKPTYDNNKPIKVNFSMDLYQLLELRWYDEFLYWDPKLYNNITEIRLPYNAIWLPDTTLYNSLVMKDEDQRRLLNAKLVTIPSLNTTYIEMLYPAIFKFSCLLNLRYFPYDVQRCRMIFSSWTYDKAGIDYFPHYDQIGNKSYIENEAWGLLLTLVQRVEKKFPCCPVNYTLLHYDIFLRRKPLFYFINLIIPTSIITFIALVGFFSTSSTSGMREEKVSLGITTLLSMSILMLMVSDQMPTTSTFIPLIGWFILGMIIIISFGTLASTFVIAVQKRGRMGVRLSRNALRITMLFSIIAFIKVPKHLEENKTVNNNKYLTITKIFSNLKQNRKYAEVEYEWLATVLEFYFFCIFVVLFLIIAVGINALGYYNWKIAEFLVHENIDCTSKLLNFRFRS